MQSGKAFTPPATGIVGTSSPAAGKPARSSAGSKGANQILPSAVCYGRDTMLSNSSLGDSVSQRGEAVGSITPRGEMEFAHRDGRAQRRMTLFPGEREPATSKPLDTAWRPPAGLPLPGSNGSTVSCNSSFSGAGSVGHGSNYAEASAAASYYKQRQQQHSSCIFGDGSDSASSVVRSLTPAQATESDFRPHQRGAMLEDGSIVRSGKQQNSSQVLVDRLRPAGMPTVTGHSHYEQQHQGSLLQGAESVEQQLQQCAGGTNTSSVTAPSLLPKTQNSSEETPKLQIGHLQPQKHFSEQHMGQLCPAPQQEGGSVHQWLQDNSLAGASSSAHVSMDMSPVSLSNAEDSARRLRMQRDDEAFTNAVMQDKMQHCAPESPASKSLDAQPISFQRSPGEFVHPAEGSTASSNDCSPSPASPSTPLPDEQEVDMEHRQPQEHSLNQHLMHTAEEKTFQQTSDQELPHKSHSAEAFACGASPCPSSPRSNRARWHPGPEDGDSSASLRRGRDSLTSSRGARSLDISSFVPRDDPRSSREKQIQALRSTGSVMPVSAAADAAVAAAAAAASSRYYGGNASGRGMTDGSTSDIGVGSSNEGSRAAGHGSLDAHAALYPLSLMGRDTEQKDGGRRAAPRAGCPRLLPLDIAWHSSAASVLGNREALAQGSGTSGALCSPTSNISGDVPSPAHSNCSHGQQLTARERLLHQHCTSSVFAAEEEGTGEASSRSLRSRPSSIGGASLNRVTRSQKDEYGTKDEILQRRTDQLQNPWYSDLFGRYTPKRSPTAARCAPAAATINNTEVEASPCGRIEKDVQGASVAASSASGHTFSGVDGAALDKLCAQRR